VFGTLTFSTEYPAVIDTCMNNSGSSVIYRCGTDSIWEYVYVGSIDCMGVADAVNTYGGCTGSTMYRIENCTTAQASAKSAGSSGCKYFVTGSGLNLKGYPIDICYNTGTTTSVIYTCIGGSPYKYTYSSADCGGTLIGNSSEMNSGSYNCDGSSSCFADAKAYSTGDSCNYDESNYLSPGTSKCNYIVTSDGGYPNAIDTCFSHRQGSYKYSSKYECDSSDNNKVMLYQWLDNDACSGDTDKYLISNFTSDNYTIHCGYSNCGVTVRTYSICSASFRPFYDEYPIAMDQCIRYYNSPLDTSNEKDTTPYLDQYYMYSCIGGYLGVYYYLDSDCTQMNTFYVYNTSGDSCPTIVGNCSSGYMITIINSIVITFFVAFIKILF